ncbi:hypothetical protein LEP1GSC051_0934 [Leptospira sp. P2653]|nr:hypothetical protein LEP1GSC051_0934 [Leptospira sp. P2653]
MTSKKQTKIDFQEKMIEFAEKEYSVDTKKIWFQTLLWYWEERSRLKIKMFLLYLVLNTTYLCRIERLKFCV